MANCNVRVLDDIANTFFMRFDYKAFSDKQLLAGLLCVRTDDNIVHEHTTSTWPTKKNSSFLLHFDFPLSQTSGTDSLVF